MLRIGLLLEQCLAPVPGGTGRYSRELAGALAATAPPGGQVRGFTARHRDVRAAAVPGVAGPTRLRWPRSALVVGWLAGRGPGPTGVDLVHAPTLLAPPRRDRPLVVTVHDTVPWSAPGTLTAWGARWHRGMAARVARDADALVVPTAAVRDELAAVLPDRPPVHVIGEGVSAAFTAEPADLAGPAGRLDLPPDGYLLVLATAEPRKGLDVAVAAVGRPAAPPLPLLVVGSPGWGRADPVRMAVRAGVDPGRVRWLGAVDDADLAVLLRRATALLVPSRAEGFGLPVVEAMAVGTPVVVSRVPALLEVAGAAALTVPVDDPDALAAAAARLAGDPGLRARLVAAGRAQAARHSWTTAAGQLWRLYASLAGGSPPAAGRRPA